MARLPTPRCCAAGATEMPRYVARRVHGCAPATFSPLGSTTWPLTSPLSSRSGLPSAVGAGGRACQSSALGIGVFVRLPWAEGSDISRAQTNAAGPVAPVPRPGRHLIRGHGVWHRRPRRLRRRGVEEVIAAILAAPVIEPRHPTHLRPRRGGWGLANAATRLQHAAARWRTDGWHRGCTVGVALQANRSVGASGAPAARTKMAAYRTRGGHSPC